MSFLRATDTISGQEGSATAIIDGNVENMFYVKQIEATMDKNKEPVRTLGKRGEQQKGNGWAGSGSMTIYYVTSLFRKLALSYAKTGKDTYFTITVVNEDPQSTIGKQTVVLYNCNVDSLTLASLDVDTDTLEEEVTFTFDDFDILDEFGKPII